MCVVERRTGTQRQRGAMSKFLTAYEALGLPFWSLTVQNEPEFAAPWEACAYTAEVQKDFVAHHLGPRLKDDHPDVKILIFDHNKDHVNDWVEEIMNASSSAAEFVDGTAYHWYAGGMDRLLDGALGTPNMHRLQHKLQKLGIHNDHIVIGSESCHCPTTAYAGGSKEISWARAERYAHTILADLAAGSHGWMEWNLILDGIGGPNHLGNLCETTLLSVPHRAMDATIDASPLPHFELQQPMGNISMGDGRTREELNALGFPASFLDVGIAVQPIYFYMGHISRYVRPGSTAVMGLVHPASGDGGDIFMPEGQGVPGGGLNDLAKTGIELTVWPCEGSTRQQFKWDDVTRNIKVHGHDWLGNPTASCVGGTVDSDFHGLRLVECDDKAGKFGFRDIGNSTFQVLLESGLRTSKDHCLVIEHLGNDGGSYGRTGGAQVSLGKCSHPSAEWIINPVTGEASSLYFKSEEAENRVCMTTGWPFLQVGAFLTPEGDAPQTVVLLNEASQSANYALQDENEVLVTGMIPPRSIQTITIG
ncbi:hypothetical protein MPSEU_000787200 [Mayamaea pseudoterrestris]|nr:hypothetical protein MPSEU_000787200 [Mayamaea pseudoterrestris]